MNLDRVVSDKGTDAPNFIMLNVIKGPPVTEQMKKLAAPNRI